jgi:hypothetical protein
MKRRGGGGAAAAPSTPSSSVATADLDDRELSKEALARAANKAKPGKPVAAADAAKFPTAVFYFGLMFVAAMAVYLTVRYS